MTSDGANANASIAGSSFTSLISAGGSQRLAGSIVNSVLTTPPPADAVDYFAAGNAQLVSGHPANAIADYSKAIELNPNYAEAYLNRGMAQYTSGNTIAARQDFSIATALDPSLGNRLPENGRQPR